MHEQRLADLDQTGTILTGEEWETESSSGEEQGSESESDEADSGADDGQGEPSVIADTIGSLEEPMTQVTAPRVAPSAHSLQAPSTPVSDGRMWQDGIIGVVRFIDACLERILYTSDQP